jgi:acyl transferase domain-containing protein
MMGLFAPGGRGRPFDASAKGYVRGWGGGIGMPAGDPAGPSALTRVHGVNRESGKTDIGRPARRYQKRLHQPFADPSAICNTAAAGRTHFIERVAVVRSTAAELAALTERDPEFPGAL